MSDRLERIRNTQEPQEPQEPETQEIPEQFIVAEISKNWPEENNVLSTMDNPPRLLAQRFQACINNNWKRGYRLVDWRLSRLMSQHQNTINETIIAVFEWFERGHKS